MREKNWLQLNRNMHYNADSCLTNDQLCSNEQFEHREWPLFEPYRKSFGLGLVISGLQFWLIHKLGRSF